MANRGISFITPVASGTPFDNSTNGFLANNVQSGIEEAKNTVNYSSVNSTSTFTTTSSTFAVIDSLTITPGSGTYLVLFSGNMDITSGVNGTGEVALFSGGTQITNSTRDMTINVALLLGLIGTSTVGASGSNSMAVTSVNGAQAIDIRYRSVSGDTFRFRSGSLTIIRIAN